MTQLITGKMRSVPRLPQQALLASPPNRLEVMVYSPVDERVVATPVTAQPPRVGSKRLAEMTGPPSFHGPQLSPLDSYASLYAELQLPVKEAIAWGELADRVHLTDSPTISVQEAMQELPGSDNIPIPDGSQGWSSGEARQYFESAGLKLPEDDRLCAQINARTCLHVHD